MLDYRKSVEVQSNRRPNSFTVFTETELKYQIKNAKKNFFFFKIKFLII